MKQPFAILLLLSVCSASTTAHKKPAPEKAIPDSVVNELGLAPRGTIYLGTPAELFHEQQLEVEKQLMQQTFQQDSQDVRRHTNVI